MIKLIYKICIKMEYCGLYDKNYLNYFVKKKDRQKTELEKRIFKERIEEYIEKKNVIRTRNCHIK